jgi:hypothetical protein
VPPGARRLLFRNGLIGHIDKAHPMEILGRTPDSTMVWDVVAG